MELAKELGVTSKELMVAAEEMGHKGLRAMSPLDTTLANALRVKLGRGRELPEEPKPKRAVRPKAATETTGTDGAPVTKKAPARSKKAADVTLEESPAEIKPAATIVKPKPAPETVAEPPLVAKRESEIAPEPSVVTLAPEAPPSPPPPAPAAPGAPTTKPEPTIEPVRPIDRPAPAPPRPARQ